MPSRFWRIFLFCILAASFTIFRAFNFHVQQLGPDRPAYGAEPTGQAADEDKAPAVQAVANGGFSAEPAGQAAEEGKPEAAQTVLSGVTAAEPAGEAAEDDEPPAAKIVDSDVFVERPVAFDETPMLDWDLASPAQQLWASTEKRDLFWSHVTVCSRGGSLLLPGVPDGACAWPACLRAASGREHALDRLLRPPGAPPPPGGAGAGRKAKGSRAEPCPAPRGGQARRAGPPLVSVVFALRGDVREVASAVLGAFRVAHEVESAEFLVVDGGGAGSRTALDALCGALRHLFGADVRLFASAAAESATRAAGFALRAAKGKYAVLFDAPAFPLPGCLALLLQTMRSFPAAGMVGALAFNPEGRAVGVGSTLFDKGEFHSNWSGVSPKDVPAVYSHAHAVDHAASAAFVMVDRELFLELNLFTSETLEHADGSWAATAARVDASLTLRRAGLLTVLQPLAAAVCPVDPARGAPGADMMAWIYQKHQSTLGYHCSAASGCASPSDMQLASGYAAFVRQGTRVLIIDHCVPLVEADSGSVRMWEMMQILVDMGYAVTLQPDCPKSFARTAVPLLALGIQVLAPGSFKAMAGARGTSDVSNSVPCPWDLILISRRGVFANNIMSVDRLCPRAPLIYDTVDLHFVRERKGVELALKQGDHSNIPIGDVYRDPVELGIQQAEQILEEGERREKSYMNRSDYVLVVAPAEQKLVAELFGEKKATLLTNIYPDPDMSEDVGFAQRSGALFVGNGCHPPNLDASRFIMREIFADPTKYPSGFMHFVWSDTLRCPDVAGDIVEEARKNPSVTLHLDVSNEELKKLHFRVKFFLGALRVGAGVKGKINMALRYGLPIIASETAVDGMHMVPEEGYLPASSAEQYRRQMRRLESDEQLWQRLRTSGLGIMRTYFSRDVARKTLRRVFAELGLGPGVPEATEDGGRRKAERLWRCPPVPPSEGCASPGCWACGVGALALSPPLKPFPKEFVKTPIARGRGR